MAVKFSANEGLGRFPIPSVSIPELPGPFELELPEIYQIELASGCNYSCTMCPRNLYTRKDKTPFLDIALVQRMIQRGDFANSYFVELQMSGEPLLHPNLPEIIDWVKSTGVFVGLSTNGSLLKEPDKLWACRQLDYVTISIDAVSNREEIRIGSQPFKKMWEDYLKDAIDDLLYDEVVVDLQIIELPGWEKEFTELQSIVGIGKGVNIRTVPDCFITKFKPIDISNEKGICINPYMSCSVQSNGNVVPCCFAWGDDIIYGNVKQQSLQEIWDKPIVQNLREAHERRVLPKLCFQCYMRSPTLLHLNIFSKSLRHKVTKR